MTYIIRTINIVIEAMGNALTFLLAALPDSPFKPELFGELPEWMDWVGVFIPWEGMITITYVYVGAVLVYYILRIALRWVKGVGSG